MEKNTKWAIALCTIVLVVWGYFLIKDKNAQEAQAAARNNQTAVTTSSETKAVEENTTAAASVQIKAAETVADVDFVFSTKNEDDEKFVSVAFTNKGGDIKGIELVQHKDKDTPKEDGDFYGVEMIKTSSASSDPAAFSIALADNKVVTDNFKVACSPEFAKFVEGDVKLDFVPVEEGDTSMFVTFTQNFVNADKAYSIKKTYTFVPNEYMFKLDVAFEGNVPSKYSITTSPQIGPRFDAKDRYDYRRVIYYNSDDKDETENFGKNKELLDEDWDYVGVMGKYFEMVFLPESKKGKAAYYEMKKLEGNDKVVSNEVSIESVNAADTYYIYVGPRSEEELVKYCNASNNAWGITSRLDYSQPSSGFLSWLQTLLKWIMEGFHYLIPNWGVSIILLTILLKVALFPLTKKSLMGNQKMQKIQPQLEAIKTKYKDNPQRMQQETAKLYKETGYNPVSGCLPLILQFLVLWSMYQLFYNYFEFRGSVFIPGWIDDLSRGDTVHTFEGSYWIIGSDIRILPVIYLVSQLLYGKITQNGGTATGSQMNMKMMMYGMPILFFLMFYSAPSGLLLYWTVSNIFQLFQQIFINKTMKKNAPAENDKKFKIVKK